MVFVNETSRNKSYFLWYLPLFWPVRQLRAAVEHNLSREPLEPVTEYTHQLIYILLYILLHIDMYKADASIALRSLNLRFTQ